MQVESQTYFSGELIEIGTITVRPTDPGISPLDYQDGNVVVLPLQGVFAKHEGPRREVIGAPGHAVFFADDSPYRISFPGGIGDHCLRLSLSGAALARAMPEAANGAAFDTSAFAPQALLSPKAMLLRSLLAHRCATGEIDALEAEELGLSLLDEALAAADRREHRGARGARGHRSRRVRHLARVKEAVSLQPTRKWTLGELADLACVTPFHLSHVFTHEVGEPAYRYVLRARLGHALEAVLGGDTGLTEIALASGFTSHSHFTARFRAMFGVTPQELRRIASRKHAANLRKIVTARAAAAGQR